MAKFTDIKYFNRAINKTDGNYFSSNIRVSSQSGVMSAYNMENLHVKTAGTKTANLGILNGFAQTGKSTDVLTFARDKNNALFLVSWAGNFITQIREDQNSIAGLNSKGIALLSNGDIVTSGNRYLSKTYTTTITEDVELSELQIDVSSYPTDFSGFIYAIILKGADNRDSEAMLVSSASGNTINISSRGLFGTTETTHSSGATIILVCDTWRDTGSQNKTSIMDIIRFEDRTYVGNGNTVVGFIDEDSGGSVGTPLSTYLELEENDDIVGFGRLTGSTDYILVATNRDESSKIYVWDGIDTKWARTIEIPNRNITCIKDNLVALEDGIYKTDGINLSKYIKLEESEDRVSGISSISIQDIKRVGEYVLFTSNAPYKDRNRAGLWIYKESIDSLEYVIPSNKGFYNINMGAIHPQTDSIIMVSNNFNGGSLDKLNTSSGNDTNYMQFVWNPNDGREYTIESLELNIDIDGSDFYDGSNLDFDVVVRGYDFKTPFKRYSETSGTPSAENEIILDSTYTEPLVGDRIELIERMYSSDNDFAGQPRNITSVVEGDGIYTCTLDDDLGGIASTDNTIAILNPLKRIHKFTTTSTYLPRFYIPITKQLTGNKFMFEIEFRCRNLYIYPRLNSITIKGERNDI